MKTKGSKFLVVLLALVMVLGMLPVGQVAVAAGEYDAGFLSWDEEANNYTVHSPIRVRNAAIGNAPVGYDRTMFDTRFYMKNTGTKSWSYDAHSFSFSNTDWFTYGWKSSMTSGTVEPGESMQVFTVLFRKQAYLLVHIPLRSHFATHMVILNAKKILFL